MGEGHLPAIGRKGMRDNLVLLHVFDPQLRQRNRQLLADKRRRLISARTNMA